MKKILLLQNEKFLDSQIKKPVDYSKIIDEWNLQNGGNSGNKLFTTAIEKYLYKPDIHVTHYVNSMDIDYINSSFNMVIFPTANIFGKHYIAGLKEYAAFFNKLQIPVYVIGAGIQCKNYLDLSRLKKDIGKESAVFVDAVYHTGGELALRGEYTKQFLDALLSNTSVVTGCPSLYQNGRNLNISNEKVDFDKFRVAMNGSMISINSCDLNKIIDDITYMDQDEFCELLYDVKILNRMSDIRLLWRYSKYGLQLLSKNKVNLIYDIPVWIDYMKTNFDFSIGTRIHGNIAALLAGVPAMVIAKELRTMELAEFFEIPLVNDIHISNIRDVYNIYEKLDFSMFNKNFANKFDNFENFLISHNITDFIDDNSKWNEDSSLYKWKLPTYCTENREYVKNVLKRYPDIFLNIFSGKLYSKMKQYKTFSIDFTALK